MAKEYIPSVLYSRTNLHLKHLGCVGGGWINSKQPRISPPRKDPRHLSLLDCAKKKYKEYGVQELADFCS